MLKNTIKHLLLSAGVLVILVFIMSKVSISFYNC